MRAYVSLDALELRAQAAQLEAMRASRRHFADPHTDELLGLLRDLAQQAATAVEGEDFWESQVFHVEVLHGA